MLRYFSGRICHRVPLCRNDVHRSSSSRPLLAQPSHYVSGATLEQIESNPHLRDWYNSNIPSWQTEPDRIVVPDHSSRMEVAAKSAALEEAMRNKHAIQLPSELVHRNIRPMVAYVRLRGKEDGSRNCHQLRNPGPNDPDFPLVPGILHGSDPTQNIVSVDASSKILVKTPWFEIQREVDRYHRQMVNRVYALTVFQADDALLGYHKSPQNRPKPTYKVCQETMTITEIPPPPEMELPPRSTPLIQNALVLPADLNFHPVSHWTYCLNYIRYHPSKPIRIPILPINQEESPTMKRGGFIAFVNRTVECLVDDGAPIPETISLECSGLRSKDVVRRGRLILPEGCRIHPRVKEDYLIGTVFGVRAVEEAPKEEKKK